jgi:epsilon-lactone hydrolase
MPPLRPYPAALDDCLAVYRHALESRPPSKIIVSGWSTGANLAAALMLCAEDEGLPLPAALMLLTPQMELAAEVKRFEEQHLQS